VKITDVRAVQIDLPPLLPPSHDAGYVVPPEAPATWGYVEVLTDEGLLHGSFACGSG
jgi:hypothetical protein